MTCFNGPKDCLFKDLTEFKYNGSLTYPPLQFLASSSKEHCLETVMSPRGLMLDHLKARSETFDRMNWKQFFDATSVELGEMFAEREKVSF
jgi:hypothetical protein